MATPLVLVTTVLQGARAPDALVIRIVPDTAKIVDLTTVSAASLQVMRGDDAEQVWTCTMSNRTTKTLTLTHPWVAGDNDMAGEVLRVYALLTTGAGVVTMQRCDVQVVKR